MNQPAHKTEGENRTKTVRFYPFVSTGNGASSRGTRRTDNARGQLETGRFLFWTKDSRMHAAIDEKFYSYYTYDHSGGSCGSREQSQACLSYAEMEQRRRSQRRLKLVGVNSSVDVNAEYMTAVSTLNEPTLYPSSYMVLTNKGYTNVTEVESRASSLALPRCSNVTERKHYYAVTERVAARLGGGLNAMGNAIGYSDTLLARADTLFGQSLEQVNSRALNGNDIDCILGNGFAKEEFGHPIDGIPCQMQAGVDFFHDPFKDMVHSMQFDCNNGQEREVYFYHSDHLGSASWITDSGGQAIQHLQYLPYGEPYINQRTSGYNERYTFTGKERDEETGYGYFGARYMDHELMTMWLSVDPMADKYPSISPYAYCAWNPIIAIDPSGMDSVHTPNGIANVGDGYRATPDGKYLYGEGLQPKRWNPNLEIGGIVGDGFRGGYENCDESELPLIHNEKIINLANNAIPVAVPIGAFLWEQLSTAAGTAIEAFAAIAWIIPACLLVSSDTRPNQNVQEGNKFGENNVAETKENMYHPFAHDTKKNGKLKGGRSDRHAAQYNHGGKRRSPNPNQRKGAQERRNKGKQIN